VFPRDDARGYVSAREWLRAEKIGVQQPFLTLASSRDLFRAKRFRAMMHKGTFPREAIVT